MAHVAAADSTTRRPFRIATYCDPAVRNEDTSSRKKFRDIFQRVIPAENNERVMVVGPECSFPPFLTYQVSNMISPEISNCRDSGWIACISLISKLYAKGVTKCESILMNLSLSESIASTDRRDSVMREIVRGFKDCAAREGASVATSPLVLSKYLWIGGFATAFHPRDDYMAWNEADGGDAIVLTKPLGTLIAARYKYMVDNGLRAPSEDVAFNSRVEQAYELAVLVMRRSNKPEAKLLKSHGVHAVVDVNGRSLLESVNELARMQIKPIIYRIGWIPVIPHTPEIAEKLEIDLLGGHAPELSGGLLMCISSAQVDRFRAACAPHGYLRVFSIGGVERESEEHAATTVLLENASPLALRVLPM